MTLVIFVPMYECLLTTDKHDNYDRKWKGESAELKCIQVFEYAETYMTYVRSNFFQNGLKLRFSLSRLILCFT